MTLTAVLAATPLILRLIVVALVVSAVPAPASASGMLESSGISDSDSGVPETMRFSQVAGIPNVVRLAGQTRIQTALAAADWRWGSVTRGQEAAFDRLPVGNKAIILASGDNYPDAVVGAGLSFRLGGPILLIRGGVLDSSNRAYLDSATRSAPVYILGGTVAVSGLVEATVQEMGFRTERIAGGSRYDTAVVAAGVGQLGGEFNPSQVFVADGNSYENALVAAANDPARTAVLLSDGERPIAPTDAYIASNPNLPVFTIGRAAQTAYPGHTEIGGSDPILTSVAVAEQFATPDPSVGIALATDWPDALAGGAHITHAGGPVLLTAKEGLSAPVRSHLRDRATTTDFAFIYGGTAVIDLTVDAALGGLGFASDCGVLTCDNVLSRSAVLQIFEEVELLYELPALAFAEALAAGCLQATRSARAGVVCFLIASAALFAVRTELEQAATNGQCLTIRSRVSIVGPPAPPTVFASDGPVCEAASS